jgi:hypothetical protein
MDARLAKIRERKQRKLHETEVDKNTQEQEEKTEEISNENNEENDEMFIGAMVERIRNKGTKIEKAHLNEWERGKVGKEKHRSRKNNYQFLSCVVTKYGKQLSKFRQQLQHVVRKFPKKYHL